MKEKKERGLAINMIMPQATPGDDEKEKTTDYTDFFVFSSCLFM
jgi:hypothetical protein